MYYFYIRINLDKSFNNIIDGVLKGLTDLVVGLAQLAIGAVEYVGSCAVVVLCEPFGGAPDWIKNKVDSDNKLISSILKDPALIVEGLAQDASDAIDEKGICYSVGYLGGTFLGTKGLDKITKGVKGLISGTETATIKSLEHGATQALKSIKDILNKAGNKSIEELNKIVTKVYSRVNGVLDVEVAGYGRIRIKESSILDDVDKICKDRYTKWAEGKSSEISHVKSIADLKNTENFRNSALNHILEGEINRSNMAVGYHYEKFPTSKGKIIEGTKSSPNDLGVYTGKVQVDGVIKKAKSSFFPEEWSPQEVIDAINEAYNNKQFVKGTKNTFRGKSVSGLKIEMYIDNKGKIISAFPKY
ncbi:hypothetical protein C3B64_19855 [Clostridium botulinum]|uniref:Bacterial EndoU nuclease domain-containing protein n=1 Tax=Clostridium botulinum TaxID=1491 RepID=A0AAU8Z3N9_CLOBO|nr:hypothetical protein C3B64_19855 [Clostridium botulinum]